MPCFGFEYTMNDYVRSRLKPITFDRKLLKKDAATTALTETEQSQLRGTVAAINWTAPEGRPDASAAASILAGAFPQPMVSHALEANQVVARLKSNEVTLRIHAIPEDRLRHLLISDSAFDPTGKINPQHGWLQGFTDDTLNQGHRAPVSLMAWKSRRLRRKAGSTMLCESISLSTALGSLKKQVAQSRSIQVSRYQARQHLTVGDDPEDTLRGNASIIASENENYRDPQAISVVDAKSLYDATSSEQATGEDDRSALEIAMIQDSISAVKGRLRWVPHNENPADMQTKNTGAHEAPMMQLLRSHHVQIQSEEAVLSSGRQSENRMKVKVQESERILGAVKASSAV